MSTTTAEDVGWPELQRARRAIVVVDVVESVRLMQQHETDVINRWRRFVNEVQTQALPKHGGRLVKSLGDGMLLEFESVRPAIAAALEMQQRIGRYSAGCDGDTAILLRMGAHVADVVVDALDVYGSGVNLAARLATLAGPGEIVVSSQVRDELVPGLDADAEDIGECYLKHLALPVRAYRISEMQSITTDPQPPVRGSLQPVIAVVPFAMHPGASSEGTLADMLTDDITASLARSSSWRVISRLSASAFRLRNASIEIVGKHLRADYVLSGRCRAAQGRLAIHAELAEAKHGTIVWADTIPATAADVLAGTDAAISNIVQQVSGAVLRHALKRASSAEPRTLESYALVMAAIALMHRASRHEFDRAHGLLEFVAEREPRMAGPQTWMAKWYAIRAAQGWSPSLESDASRALDHVQRALSIDQEDALAWSVNGLIHGYIRKDLDAADRCYQTALQSNPNEALAWLYSATLHAWRDQGDAAAVAARRAQSLSPLDPMQYYFDSLSATALVVAREYAAAIHAALRSLRANRMHASTHRTLAIAQVLSGDLDAARRTVDELMVIEPGLTVETFRSRYPGRASAHAAMFADALLEAGVPH